MKVANLQKISVPRMRPKAFAVACCCVIPLLMANECAAFVVAISPGTRAIFLQVGNGTMTGGTFSAGGVPGNNTTVNQVSVSVAASAVGTGVAQQMTSNSTAANSPYDNFAFCTVPTQVYIGGFFRLPGTTGTATLSVSAPVNLTNAAGDTIPFSQIAWAASGAGDTTSPIPSGKFLGGSQTLTTFTVNQWNETCHTFSYTNTAVVAPGTYTGRATYTLSAP